MIPRLVILLALAAVVFVPAGESKSLPAPTGMHGFVLRADENFQRTFSRTPSFAWQPYEGASSYDFELAMSSKFDDRTLVWSTDGMAGGLRVPAVSIPLALPWMTGKPYALYVRVRAHVADHVTRWSTPFGFNTSWSAGDGTQEPPLQQMLPDIPGLVRWTPVDGATSYQVWFNPSDEFGSGDLPAKIVSTTTNVADEREFYAPQLVGAPAPSITWRVRAVRQVYGNLPNGLPRTTYGPWTPSQVPFVSVISAVQSDPSLTPSKTVSDVITVNDGTTAQTLTPGFAFTGDSGAQLFRVYVASDNRCVNIVYKGSVVGSPAYAPRTSAQGPGAQPGKTADGDPVTPNEASGAVDLWDLGRKNARYWWTIVPVQADKGGFQDQVTPQDACEAGHVMQFAKTSSPVTAGTTRPYASGLSRFGGLVAAATKRPSFSRATLVAWEPAKGATSYEVQWSRSLSAWKTESSVTTPGTSVLAQNLAPGTWYYKVRGIDDNALGFKQMAWSKPVGISIERPRFFNESNVSVHKVKK